MKWERPTAAECKREGLLFLGVTLGLKRRDSLADRGLCVSGITPHGVGPGNGDKETTRYVWAC